MQELSALRLANTRSDTVSHLALSPETQTVTISTNAYNSWERELEDNITFLYRPFHLPPRGACHADCGGGAYVR